MCNINFNFIPFFFLQIICGQNCTFVIQANGSALACGEGSYGRLGQGNSDDLRTLTLISTLQGKIIITHKFCFVQDITETEKKNILSSHQMSLSFSC